MKKSGLDLTGYSHVITADEIRHVINRHGRQSNDSNPIDFEDFLLIPFIIAKPDKVEISNVKSKKHALPVIHYEKQIGDRFVVLEEVRSGRKKLAILSFYKKTARNKP